MNNELELVTRPSTDVVDGSRFVTSINVDDEDGAINVLNALSDAEDIRNHLGKVISVVDFAAEPCYFEDETTHEIYQTIRIVLIDVDGKAYQSFSNELVRSLNRIFGILGTPDKWKKPLNIIITDELSNKKHHFFKVKVVK